jgi:peptidoglycan/xylan/chitin deacetylase (PgdA/CDA1 family)/negative regulator of sigma E activity
MRPSLRRRIALLAVCAPLLLASFIPDRSALGAAGLPDVPPPGVADDEAIGWLTAAAVAPRRVSYIGTKTVTLWAQTVRASEVRVYHEAPDRTRLEYLATGDQPARVVVISGGHQIEFVPGSGRYLEGPALRTDEDALTRQILPQLAANYDVRFAGIERVAGRAARVVEIEGKRPGRPRLRLWIDIETRLILRLERYGPAGALREISAFLNVVINPRLSADLFLVTPPAGAQIQQRRPGASGGPSLGLDEIARRVGFIPQLPGYLPPGYKIVRSNVVLIRGAPTATFVFSDGVAALTLYESRGAQVGGGGGQHVRVGAADGIVQVRGVATVIHWNTNGVSMTLVGDIAPNELVRVGSSVPGGTSRRGPARSAVRAVRRITAWIAAFVAGRPAAAEAAAPPQATAVPSEWPGVPPVPVSPFITNDTHPIGPGIWSEEKRIWTAFVAEDLAPVVVKVTVASDGVTKLPSGQLSRLVWIWFVYGMDRETPPARIADDAVATARALALVAARTDRRVDRITLSGYYQVPGRFDGRRTDVTLTASLDAARLLQESGGDARAALQAAGDLWLAPELLEGSLVPQTPLAHDPHLPAGMRGPVLPGARTYESAERFDGTLPERIVDTKRRLEGLLFGAADGRMLWRGNPQRREIALTFDDGPSPLATPLLLAVLRRYNVRATFFVIGEHARAYPYLLTAMEAGGNEVGDHTYHHPNMVTVGDDVATNEIAAGAEEIDRTAGLRAHWFRPPGGDYTAVVAADARRLGLGLAMWTTNSGDWTQPPARIVAERVLARAEPGAIVLMHNGTLTTVRALPAIIAELRRRGYALVTVSELARDAE